MLCSNLERLTDETRQKIHARALRRKRRKNKRAKKYGTQEAPSVVTTVLVQIKTLAFEMEGTLMASHSLAASIEDFFIADLSAAKIVYYYRNG